MVIKCYVFVGVRNEDDNSRWTRESGSIDTKGTSTLSCVGVARVRQGVLGGVQSKYGFMSSSQGNSYSSASSQ